MKRFLTVLLFGFLVFLSNVGCFPCNLSQKIAEKAVEEKIKHETGEDVDVDISSSSEALRLIPAPLRYPGAHVKGKVTSSTEKGKGSVVVLSTNDPLNKVIRFYKNRPGYSVILNATTLRGGMITLKKRTNEDEGAMVFIGKDEDNASLTNIVITLIED